MRHLIEQPFVTATKQPFRLTGVRGNPEKSTDAASVGEVLHWLLSCYEPRIVQRPLPVGDLRKLNRLIDTLEKPCENSGYDFEDADFALMRELAPQIASLVSPRNAPVIEDILTAAQDASRR